MNAMNNVYVVYICRNTCIGGTASCFIYIFDYPIMKIIYVRPIIFVYIHPFGRRQKNPAI